MNKETQQILDYIKQSGYYLEKIDNLKLNHRNIKEFTNQLLYVIMEIVNEEKKFVNIPRKNIDVIKLTEYFF